jgi:GWxTD domain-containing protein
MERMKRLIVIAVLALAGLGLATAEGRDKLSPESKTFYRSARLIMTGQEDKIWKHLPDEDSRKEFIKDFWAKRDPDPDTEDNEYKRMFEARVAYANKRFREGGLGMNTDRGRIYIFLGPPDKTEEYNSLGNPTAGNAYRLWWIYYGYRLGIEFLDERGFGVFKFNRYDGDFFGAMQDMVKLGQWVGPDSIFKKRVVNFDANYNTENRELDILVPAKDILFKENDEGKLQIDLDFRLYVYPNEGLKKEKYAESRTFVTTQPELEELKDVPFRFSIALKPGTNYVDVIIKGQSKDSGKVRKIFEFKVKS